MEIVENKKMFYMVQDTPFNRKYNDYKVGDVFVANSKHNPKKHAYRKAFFSLHKTERQKRIMFIEDLHEKVRKSIDKNLPSRQASIVVFENLEQCEALAKKWARFNISPLHIFEVELTGKLHKCSCTPDDEKENLSEQQHTEGITTYWKGEKDTGLSEYLFQGKVKVTKDHRNDLENSPASEK